MFSIIETIDRSLTASESSATENIVMMVKNVDGIMSRFVVNVSKLQFIVSNYSELCQDISPHPRLRSESVRYVLGGDVGIWNIWLSAFCI